MQRDLINKVENVNIILTIMSFLIFFGVAMGLLNKPTLTKMNFITIIVMIVFILGLIISSKFLMFIENIITSLLYKVKIRDFEFYEINGNFYSKNWVVQEIIESQDIVTINGEANTKPNYYLINDKCYTKITKEQYINLNKLMKANVKPLLMLTKDEYNNLTDNKLKTFSLC